MTFRPERGKRYLTTQFGGPTAVSVAAHAVEHSQHGGMAARDHHRAILVVFAMTSVGDVGDFDSQGCSLLFWRRMLTQDLVVGT